MTGPVRTALVTGAAQGIGAAIVAGLRADGLEVSGIDVDAVTGVGAVDVTDGAAVDEYVARAGPFDVLVNCAGGVRGQTHVAVEDVTDADWHAVVDANLTGAFHCVRAVVPAMKEQGWGRIVTISSGAGRTVSLTGIQAYASAKAGQIALTRQLAHELGAWGITVNCVAPGFVLSNPTTRRQWESYGAAGQAELVAGIALRRLGTPEDIAHGVRFFAGEQASWVTGQTLSIDGGHTFV